LFFYRFATLSALAFKEIHSELFLSTCEQYLNLIGIDFCSKYKSNFYIIIDKFNSKTFIPLRADANGNISVCFIVFIYLLLINYFK